MTAKNSALEEPEGSGIMRSKNLLPRLVCNKRKSFHTTVVPQQTLMKGQQSSKERKYNVEKINVHRIFNKVIFVKNILTLSVCCKTFIDLTS